MQNCLFAYQRKAVNHNGEECFNNNYLNPMQIISCYWEDTETGKRLNVYLVNGKSVIFPESIGTKLVAHLESFLRFLIWGKAPTTPTTTQQTRQRREPISAEIVDEQPDLGEASFVG